MASATGEAGDQSINPNLQVSPSRISIVNRYRESDFHFVDESYIAASGDNAFANAEADDEADDDSSDEE